MTIILLFTVVAILLMLLKKSSQTDASVLTSRLDVFEKTQERTERAVREEVAQSRNEMSKAAREQRQELIDALKTFGDSVIKQMMDVASMQKGQLDVFSNQLATFAKASGERLDAVRAESSTGAKQLREEVVATLSGISGTITKTMSGLASVQKAQLEAFANQLATFAQSSGERLDGVRLETATGGKQLREEVVMTLKSISETMAKTMKDLAVAEKIQIEDMSSAIGKLSDSNEKKLEAIRVTVEGKLQSMQIDNAKQLEQMRQTVDEKLQGTLEKRL
ncbi:MAG: hypothetical protein Q7R42_09015, partial [Candidatus Planktophila sp.]|nr:hypothetical protein [Candidatus Planktophila sp.]